MPYITRSRFAAMAQNPRDVKNRKEEKPYGLCVHTTGRGILDKAKTRNVSPLTYALQFYTTPGNNFAHYVCAGDGTLIQIADERECAWHVRIEPKDYALMLSGEWESKISHHAREEWKKRWPKLTSPIDLLPKGETSPNQCYIGIELIPSHSLIRDSSQGYGLFTNAQYQVVNQLYRDMLDRYATTLLLVGHEDLNPIERSDNQGGWDPGAIRQEPRYFDWSRVVTTDIEGFI